MTDEEETAAVDYVENDSGEEETEDESEEYGDDENEDESETEAMGFSMRM